MCEHTAEAAGGSVCRGHVLVRTTLARCPATDSLPTCFLQGSAFFHLVEQIWTPFFSGENTEGFACSHSQARDTPRGLL